MPQPQSPILTVTLNPALDMSTTTATVTPGVKLRCDAPQLDPGGGGVNISRAIAVLGGETTALVALGGATGAQVARLLAAEGISTVAIDAPSETRQSIAVTDRGTMAQYRFVLPGPVWTAEDVQLALQAISDKAPVGGLVVISGSQPPGFPDDFLVRIAQGLPASAHLVADTSGAALHALTGRAPAHLAVLRMDAEEAEDVAQTALPSREDSANFAASLVARGVAATVIIARGPDGSVLATRDGRWFCEAAKVPVNSKVGAGDSFVAAYVLAVARGMPAPEALAAGVAAASAAVMTPATELCRRADAEALIKACPVSAL